MAALATGGVAQSERAATSFQRKVPDGGGGRLAVLPGTRPSVRHGQLLVSSGLPSLDHVLGGGLAVGTLLLIEEDVYGLYSNLLFKHFLAEGIVCGHNLFIASAKEEPTEILKAFPAPLNASINEEEEPSTAMKCKQNSQESMKIAWRYQNIPTLEASSLDMSHFRKMAWRKLSVVETIKHFKPKRIQLFSASVTMPMGSALHPVLGIQSVFILS